MMVSLTPRLMAVAAYVKKGSTVADIGTDHAYIPAYLLENGIINKAYACDVRQGPLANAEKTIREHRLSGVEFILSDGLERLRGKVFDTVIMAGMGGELIAEIMDKDPWCKNKKYHFILQPMTKADVLRRFLYQNGFEILEETLAPEKDKLYNILSVVYTGACREVSEAFALLGKCAQSPYFEKKRSAELMRLQRIYDALAFKQDASTEREQVLRLMKETEEYTC